jgi:WD40 repeat protein
VRGVTARVYTDGKRLALGAAATGAHWIGASALITLGDGGVVIANGESSKRVEAHKGVILSACLHPDQTRLLTGGDDGRILSIDAEAKVETFAQHRKWVDHLVASAASGVIVAGVGKQAIVYRDSAELHRFEHPSSIGGLALDVKGRRLAASHYGGVTLRLALAGDDKGQTLKWAGSHLGATMSPDGQYVITAMQENALHGWRLPEKTDLRMDGYPAKTRSLSWDKRGRWLATSGAESAIVWPFIGKLGPQGKPPLQLGAREALVTAVAFHPVKDLLAVGYGDGAVVAVDLSDNGVSELDEPGAGAVSAMAWSADGAWLALGDEAGRGAIVAAP